MNKITHEEIKNHLNDEDTMEIDFELILNYVEQQEEAEKQYTRSSNLVIRKQDKIIEKQFKLLELYRDFYRLATKGGTANEYDDLENKIKELENNE